MEQFTVRNPAQTGQYPLRARCPRCRHQGVLEPVGESDWQLVADQNRSIVAGQRKCPNPDCVLHVFVIYDKKIANAVVAMYPPEVIDFDTADVPENIVGTLNEALLCESAGCYRASALMLRRTLEELCAHHGAEGKTLMGRIGALSQQITLPVALAEGMHGLRLLGNDAGHVVAKDYDEIGVEEISVAVEVTKLLIQAAFQVDSVVERLRGLTTSEG